MLEVAFFFCIKIILVDSLGNFLSELGACLQKELFFSFQKFSNYNSFFLFDSNSCIEKLSKKVVYLHSPLILQQKLSLLCTKYKDNSIILPIVSCRPFPPRIQNQSWSPCRPNSCFRKGWGRCWWPPRGFPCCWPWTSWSSWRPPSPGISWTDLSGLRLLSSFLLACCCIFSFRILFRRWRLPPLSCFEGSFLSCSTSGTRGRPCRSFSSGFLYFLFSQKFYLCFWASWISWRYRSFYPNPVPCPSSCCRCHGWRQHLYFPWPFVRHWEGGARCSDPQWHTACFCDRFRWSSWWHCRSFSRGGSWSSTWMRTIPGQVRGETCSGSANRAPWRKTTSLWVSFWPGCRLRPLFWASLKSSLIL